MKPNIEQQLIAAIQMMKINWRPLEENSGSFTTGMNYFDKMGRDYGDEAVRDWVEANRHRITESDWPDYDMERFDEQAFVQGFWWAAQRWLKHIERNCDRACRSCQRDTVLAVFVQQVTGYSDARCL